jgi:hypothetical protein
MGDVNNVVLESQLYEVMSRIVVLVCFFSCSDGDGIVLEVWL